jgi:hypothetical protein
MVNIIRDIEAKAQAIPYNATPYDIGYNAGLEAAKAIIYMYSSGSKCIMCGETEYMDEWGNCSNCGFKGFGV